MRRWYRGGVIVGLLLWVAALPALGDPRISYVVPPVGGQTLPVMVARSSFQMMAETPTPAAGQTPTSANPTGTHAQAQVFQPVMAAMAIPDVRAMLSMGETRPIQVTPTQLPPSAQGPTDPRVSETPATAGPKVSSLTAVPSPAAKDTPRLGQAAPAAPEFSYPGRLAPGAPAATVAQVANPTKDPIRAEIRPAFDPGQDTRLCSALRGAIVSLESGKAPRLMTGGGLQEMAQGTVPTMELEPGERYNLAILVAVPWDLPNEYQGLSCTVNFMMHSQGAQS